MANWKSALAALGVIEEANDNKEKSDIDCKKPNEEFIDIGYDFDSLFCSFNK